MAGGQSARGEIPRKRSVFGKNFNSITSNVAFLREYVFLQKEKKKVMIIKLMLTCQGRDGSLKLKPGENLQGLGKTFKNVFNSFVEV